MLSMNNLSIIWQAELAGTSDEASSTTPVGNTLFMEDDFYPFP